MSERSQPRRHLEKPEPAIDVEFVEIDEDGNEIDPNKPKSDNKNETNTSKPDVYPKNYEPIYQRVLDPAEFQRLLSTIDADTSNPPESRVSNAIKIYIGRQVSSLENELRQDLGPGAKVAFELPDDIKQDLVARLEHMLEAAINPGKGEPEATSENDQSAKDKLERRQRYEKIYDHVLAPKSVEEFVETLQHYLNSIDVTEHEEQITLLTDAYIGDKLKQITTEDEFKSLPDEVMEDLEISIRELIESKKTAEAADVNPDKPIAPDEADTEVLPANPEALAQAQKLAKEHWTARRKFIQDQLKKDQSLVKRNWAFELARTEAALKQINTGKFSEEYTFEATFYRVGDDADKGEIASKTESLEEYFKDVVATPEDKIQVPAIINDPSELAAKRQEIRDQAIEILAAIERINTPETAQEKQERLAKEARQDVEKAFWKHYNELKLGQKTERMSVEHDDRVREKQEKDRLDDLQKQKEAEQTRLDAILAEQDRKLKKIDVADKITDRVKRIEELQRLALEYSGQPGSQDIKDLGIYAAKRISKSHTMWKTTKKETDYILQKMALEKGNKAAAKSMRRVRFPVHPETRHVYKSRRAVLKEMDKKAKANGNSN